jgi:PAS domain-containing protein
MDVPEGLEKADGAAPMTNTSSATSMDSVQSRILPQSHHQRHRALHDHSQQLPQQLHEQQLHEQQQPEQSHPLHQLASPHPHHVDSLNFGQHHPNSKFMSNAANSEYSILSDIIRQEDYMDMQHRTRSITPGPPDIYTTLRQGDKSINQYMLGHVQDQLLTYPQVRQHIEGERLSEQEHGKKGALSFSIAFDDQAEYSPLSPFGLRFKDSEDIYSKIGSPFSYTPGFHSLIRYLKQRFNRQDLIKMAKAMSSYRPSFIACTNTLKEDDLIFMEQCFQRTLLEYDKFISTSGTPTIVWRRTGQIAYVSEEFCILTGWTKEELLNKVTFIVELMDDPSVVEYFNLFSTIAYGDFRGATMAGCTLITQDRSTIKTTCMWTLKRDVFGIPMMIVGNFLPILQ